MIMTETASSMNVYPASFLLTDTLPPAVGELSPWVRPAYTIALLTIIRPRTAHHGTFGLSGRLERRSGFRSHPADPHVRARIRAAQGRAGHTKHLVTLRGVSEELRGSTNRPRRR